MPNAIPTGPDSTASSLKETCFRRAQAYIIELLVRGVYERKWNSFLLATQRYNRISPWRRRKWKLSGRVSLAAALPYCANRNIIEIRIPNYGKQLFSVKFSYFSKRKKRKEKESKEVERNCRWSFYCHVKFSPTIVGFSVMERSWISEPIIVRIRTVSVLPFVLPLERDTDRVLQ